MPEFGRFEFPSEEETKLRGSSQCFQCDRRATEMDKQNVYVEDNGNKIKINGRFYKVGQFLLITDSTFRFKIPAKVPKSYPKQKVDPVMYPEHQRKLDVYEGDNSDAWELFQIVRLEQIVSTGREM